LPFAVCRRSRMAETYSVDGTTDAKAFAAISRTWKTADAAHFVKTGRNAESVKWVLLASST
jgi:hypothetical protein